MGESRLELVTPATQKAVEAAFASHDNATLEKHGRFLEPILQTMMATESDRGEARKLATYLSAVQSVQIAQNLSRR